MKIFITFCFLMLGMTFYQMSGGAEFQPSEQADASPVSTAEETLASASSLTGILVPVSTSSIEDRLATALVSPQVVAAPIDPVTPQATPVNLVIESAEDTPAAVLEPVPEPISDLRQVAGSRVNMRDGPGTDYAVLVTLNSGTTAEVLSQDDNGWVRVRVENTGQEGWMAARLLEPING